ncbi:MAG: hypothetical protein ACYDCN_04980 [Bacteroidia bacterium]
MKKISSLFILLILQSCHENSKKEEAIVSGLKVTTPVDSLVKKIHTARPKDSGNIDKEDNFKLDNYIVYAYTPNDVTTINKTCAVIIYPTTDQSAKIQKQMSEEDFSTVADDYSFYQSQYLEVASKRKIETTSPDTRYIKFVGNKRIVVVDRCAKVSSGWMVILFRPDSLPKISGEVEADTAFVNYFGK